MEIAVAEKGQWSFWVRPCKQGRLEVVKPRVAAFSSGIPSRSLVLLRLVFRPFVLADGRCLPGQEGRDEVHSPVVLRAGTLGVAPDARFIPGWSCLVPVALAKRMGNRGSRGRRQAGHECREYEPICSGGA